MHTDPFATEADQYAHLRPTYPESLFTYLSTTVASRAVASDCATGNGQAATHFRRVIPTDESAEMIAEAPRDPKVVYWIAEAEDSGIETHSVGLNKVYTEVPRVVKPGGVKAAWTYYTLLFGSAIDSIIQRLVREVLADYWDERLHYIVDEFHDLHFPLYERIERV